MLLSALVSVIMKDLRRGSSIILVLILIVPSFFVMNFVSENLVLTEAQQYHYDSSFPWDILVVDWRPYGNSTHGNMSLLAEEVKRIEGIKYVIFPESIVYYGWARYEGKSYFLYIQGVNITDPKFPKPKYLVAGSFFKSNHEFSAIIDSVGATLLEKIGIFKGVGNNKTLIDLGVPDANISITFSIKGIIDNPISAGNNEELLKLTDGIDIYLPVGAYNELFKTYKSLGLFGSKITFFPAIKIAVEDPRRINEIAQNIKEEFPGVVLRTKSEIIKSIKDETLFETVLVILLTAPIIIFLLTWDIKRRRKEISTLKVFGWTKKHVLLYNLLRISIMGLIAGFLGLFIPVLLGWIMVGFMVYTLYLFLLFLPYQLALLIGISLAFSIPAIIIAYNTNPEEAVRE